MRYASCVCIGRRGIKQLVTNLDKTPRSLAGPRSAGRRRRSSSFSIQQCLFLHSFIRDCISYAYLSLDSAGWKRIYFTLAALTKSKYSRTSRRVWDDEEGVIWLCVLRRSKSSDIWRLCRVSVGLFLDYG
ncbi:hypothetical protein VNO77_36856 [Canavalia gladiata]|uniref:Uncharacterized protein n=1 Tax=Canavalia gladiata TaxID=3824 RepID=A0AAN9PUI7_CANGL